MRHLALLSLPLSLLIACGDKDADTGDDGGTVDTAGVDADGDGVAAADDCDDLDPDVFPGAEEVCDEVDNNCDGQVDEGVTTTFYGDRDGDGFGVAERPVEACELGEDMAAQPGDCDDEDAEVNPEAAEVCNGVDDDCDGATDSADEDVDLSEATLWFVDADADGHGDAADAGIETCDDPSGGGTAYALEATDCDDTDAAVNPDATEVCDDADVDEDCSGWADDADPGLDTSTASTWIIDGDDDGFGDAADAGTLACDDPSTASAAYTTDATDCDDTDAAVNPDATEVCDEVDNDCDGDIDDADAGVDTATASTWYADADTDGHGDAGTAALACAQPSGMVADATDCDDTDAAVNPGATEVCDASDVDEDCSGAADDADPGLDTSTASTWIIDGDDDGYGDEGDAGTLACDDPSTASVAYTTDATDCDDTDAAVNPDATEVCDEVDNDCDGDIDDDDAGIDTADQTTWYTDADADGFGDAASSSLSCEQPSGMVGDDTDCDDTAATIHPGAEVLCGDGVVNDCDLTQSDEEAECRWATTYDLDEADALLTITDEAWATSLAHGDLDGDGLDEFAIGVMWTDDTASSGSGTDWGYGAVYIMDGSQHGEVEVEDEGVEISGSSSADFLGSSVDVVPDLDGDGIDELLVGATNANYADEKGSAYLIMGPFTGGEAASLATMTWTGSTDGDGLGTLVRAAGDLDDDGTADLLLGAVGADTDASNGGSLYVVSSSATGSADMSTATAELYGDRSWDAVGYDNSADGTSDVDGDGQADLVLGAGLAEDDDSSQGVAYVFYGPLSGSMNVEDADARLLGSTADAYLGAAVKAGFDLDGDGTDDIALGAPRDETGGSDAGAVYVVEGDLEGDAYAADAAMLTILGTEEVAAGGMVDVDDQDGDGTPDILIGNGWLRHKGSSSAWFSADNKGPSWLFLAPSTGTMSVSSASVTFGESGDDAGIRAAFLGDLGGDGAQEVGLLDPDFDSYTASQLSIFAGAGW